MFSDQNRKTLTQIVADLTAMLAEDGSADRDLELSVRLRTAAGWHPDPGLLKVAPIRALMDEGISLQDDILPVITAKASMVQERTKWTYFIDAIRERHAKRTGPPPITISANRSPKQWKAWRDYFYNNGQSSKVYQMDARGYYTLPAEFPPKETPAVEAGVNSGGGSKTAAPETSVPLT